MSRLSAEEVAQRIIKLYGSGEALLAAINKGIGEFNVVWDQDNNTLGRILRAHLFVEHFLTLYLKSRNPNLIHIDTVRLSFAQKVGLADDSNLVVSYLFPGVRYLNKIRNRISHTLSSEITNADRDSFLAIGLFRELRKALARPLVPSDDPLIVLEDFAKHTGLMLQAASDPDDRIQRAIRGE